MDATATKKTTTSESAVKRNINNHKKVADHLQQAARFHLEAAEHHAAGHHEMAAQSTISANRHLVIGTDGHRDDAKQHALDS